jgi:pyrroloquinoline quinone biosynthesis protein D
VSDASARVPAFANGVKFRFDAVRKAWVVLAPERMFVPDEPAVEVLQLVDGARREDEIVAALSAKFGVPVEAMRADVGGLLGGLADKGVIRWNDTDA